MPAKSQGRGSGKPFTKGDPRAGRPAGVQNKTTVEVRDISRKLIEDPVYLQNLEIRLKTGEAAPAVETMVWHYAYGKPADKVEVSGPDGAPVSILDQTQRLTSEEQRQLMAELVAGARARIGQTDDPPAEEPDSAAAPEEPAGESVEE